MLKEHFLFFYSGKNPYRINRFSEEMERRKISYEFIDMESIVFSNDFIHNFAVKNPNSIGYFLGYSEMSRYLILALGDKINFPQQKAWELADKFKSHIFLSKNDIKTPRSGLILAEESIESIAQEIGGFPCVIKKTTGGNGKMVEIVSNKGQCLDFINAMKENISADHPFPRIFSFLLQELIKESKGVDYRALCVGGEILGLMKRISQGDSFKANFSLGGLIEQVDMIEEIKAISRKIMKKTGLLIAGIDFIKSQKGYQVLEINTSPQFKGFEQVTNINVAGKVIEEIIERIHNN